jgi:hypothetical protein
MAVDGDGPIGVDELERALRAADPGARLVPARVLRRLIRRERRLPPIGLQVPHRKSYAIAGREAVAIVGPGELGLAIDEEPPANLVLIARPDPEDVAALPRGEVLRKYWRLLFHGHIHLTLEGRIADGAIDDAGIRARVARIGQVEFDEIRSVLRQEGFLLPPRDDATVYVEFAAVYLGLRMFAETLIPHAFPALDDLPAIDRLLAEDVDARAIFERTRPEGAPDPAVVAERPDDEEEMEPDVEEPTPGKARRSEAAWRRLMKGAEAAEAAGNSVRAAILRTQATRVAPTGLIGRARDGARAALDRLAERLGAALGLDEAGVRAWRRALPALLPRSAVGVWTAEARLLYDLQAACVDHERAIYKVDLVEWALSRGRRPIKRPLPHQRDVLMAKHLRSAVGRLGRARLSDRDRNRLAPLLRDSADRASTALRDRVRPLLAGALEQTGLVPRNLPERVALGKLVEELLDRVVDRGFLTMPDLRDGLSRSHLKLPDVAGPGEWLWGDRLLRADRALAVVLDGIYHRGEVYLRWLQRFSALSSGTRVGRFLSLYVALPFGGAYALLVMLQEIAHLAAHPLGLPPVHWVNPFSVGVFGTLFLALIAARAFRDAFLAASLQGVRWARWLVYDLPAWALAQPLVRRIIDSHGFALVMRSLVVPGVVAALGWALLPRSIRHEPRMLLWAAVLFLLASLALNSRVGRDFEEAATDTLAWVWRRLRLGILPGLYHFFMDLAHRFLEDVDRVLYTVDEWLRFRSGQGQGSLVAKAVLGVLWFAVTYAVRVVVNLFIEPTFNPIKHFPVVTVAAKMILPFYHDLTHAFAQPFQPLGHYAAGGIAWFIFFLIPGLAGFIVWELKENWRLYEANRPTTLRPVMIGHHGETLARLLRPGFHSGTIPKLYARLRRAERQALLNGRGRSARKHREALHHVAEAVGHFVERDLIALLAESRSLGRERIESGTIDLATNRIRVELRRAEAPGEAVRIAFEEQSGWLVAEVSDPAWIAGLDPGARARLAIALGGFYTMAGVDLVREQVAASLGPGPVAYDIGPDGLVVWPGEDFDAEAVYKLRNGPQVAPRARFAARPVVLPHLDTARLLFRNHPIPWRLWVDAWERDQAGLPPPEPLADLVELLPDTDAEVVRVQSPPWSTRGGAV